MPRPGWLETLGRASLPVFCAHLVLVLLTLGFLGASHTRPWWEDALLLAGCFACLTVVAHISTYLDRKSAAELLAASIPPLQPGA
jgi:peptidoglycan/LPS O-acetylase OafA/YrhL